MKCVIWGTGNYYNNYKRYIKLMGVEIVALVDQDKSKQGTMIDNLEVIAPESILNSELDVIIAMKSQENVRDFLISNGYIGNVYSIQDFPFEYVKENRQQMEKHYALNNQYSGEKTIIFDIIGGLGWAGTEKWAYNSSGMLKERGFHSFVLGDTSQPELEKMLEENTIRIERSSDYLDTFLAFIGENLPVVYFSNFWDESQKYAMIAKGIFGEKFKLIQVFHSDAAFLYDNWKLYCRYWDYTLCVSSKIRNKCISIKPNMACYIDKILMTYKVESGQHFYSNKDEIIRIGWAGRLVKSQKRADLLIEIIELLEQKGVKFVLEIAGEGECLAELQSYIKKYKKEEHVKCLGYMQQQQMVVFWKNVDIFLSMSEEEGASLSMIESMSYGCVPVVTDVSGVSDFIIDGWNGFVVPVEDWKRLIDKISILDKDRKLLEEMGNRSKQQIREKCSEEEFVNKLILAIEG